MCRAGLGVSQEPCSLGAFLASGGLGLLNWFQDFGGIKGEDEPRTIHTRT